MNLLSSSVLNIYSIILLGYIYYHAIRFTDKYFLTHKVYMYMLQVTILMLIVDNFSRFDGNPGTIYSALNFYGNFFIFLLNPILPTLWLLYVHCQIYHEVKISRNWFYTLIIINVINAIFVLLSQVFGWYYYIDEENIYHRGSLFWIPVSFTVILAVLAFTLVIVNRKRIEKKYYFSLVFFPVMPLIGVFLQIILYGIPLMLNCVALSLFIVFINIQNRSMNIDFLTGVYNRKKLETYMEEKIRASTENNTFSAILIDLNNFKQINDTYGHDMGDFALETSVKLIKSCLGTNDFVARFGGDEFYIILDTSNKNELEEVVSRLNNSVTEYNRDGTMPYKLGFSMGYSVYDYNSHLKVDEFQKQIDILMYKNKRNNK